MILDKDKIEDALIHLEDMGYIFDIRVYFRGVVCDQPNLGTAKHLKIYDLLKGVTRNTTWNNITIDIITSIIGRSTKVKDVYKIEEWNRINSEITTAIKRITPYNPDGTSISMKDGSLNIDISHGKSIDLSRDKVDQILTLCRKYNNALAPGLVIYPEWHDIKGIVIYVRETPDSKDHKRMDTFNKNISNQKYIDVKKSKIMGHDVEITSTTRVENCLLNDFKIVKLYPNEDQVFKDNPHLNIGDSTLDKYIVAELEII